MRTLVLAACLALTACATPTGPLRPENVTMTAERGATLARALHATSCQAVLDSHASGVLTGTKFNTAKRLCIQADTILDGADDALAAGDLAKAANNVQASLAVLETVRNYVKGVR